MNKRDKYPRYSYGYLVQKIFDAAVELTYHNENIPDNILAESLFDVVHELDKYKATPRHKKKDKYDGYECEGQISMETL